MCRERIPDQINARALLWGSTMIPRGLNGEGFQTKSVSTLVEAQRFHGGGCESAPHACIRESW
jgi:hypothetical protein